MCPKKFIYPVARRDDEVLDDYHGMEVADPYRWLEDLDSAETCEYIAEQNRLTHSYLDTHPTRTDIHRRLTHLSSYAKYFSPQRVGNLYVFRKSTGLQNQADLYFQDELVDSVPRMFLDVNSLSDEGRTSLGRYSFSEDCSMLAYTLGEYGADWCTIHIKDVVTEEDFLEVLRDVKFTCLSWSHDNKGFFYCRYLNVEDESDEIEPQKIFYHYVETPQNEDIQIVILENYPQLLLVDSRVSHCGNYLIVMASNNNNLVFLGDLTAGVRENLVLKPVIIDLDAEYEYVTNIGPEFYFLTDKNAPNRRIIQTNINDPSESKWIETLAEHETNVLENATVVNVDKLVVTYIEDVKHIVELRDLKTGEFLKLFPTRFGQVESVNGHRKHSEVFIKLISFLIPGRICHYNIDTMNETVFRETILKCFDVDNYDTQQVFYYSKDETKIPMYIVSNKDFVKDGTRPVFMYGYGGFNRKVLPSFNPLYLVFMEHFHGAVAVVNIRGGGEYGKTWHDAGKLTNKQNSFDDFQAAAEYLIDNKYTNRSKLTIHGTCNGGLLVGACINQRPDLFGVAIATVGVMDMLRYHNYTTDFDWVTDYGSSDDKDEFDNLIQYSPIHNVADPEDEKTQYPATLLLTADRDRRVVPLHSLKLIATLQETLRDSPKQTNPLMIRVEIKTDHGDGKSTKKDIEEYTDILCFIERSMKGLYCHCSEVSKEVIE